MVQNFHSVTGCQTNHLDKPDNVKLGVLLRWNIDHLEKIDNIIEYFSCPLANLSSVRIKRAWNKLHLLISSFPYLPGLFLDMYEAIPILCEGCRQSRTGCIQNIIPYLTLLDQNKMLTFCKQHLGNHCFRLRSVALQQSLRQSQLIISSPLWYSTEQFNGNCSTCQIHQSIV